MTPTIQRGNVVEVSRERPKGLAGKGMLKGLVVVFDHWRKAGMPAFHSLVSGSDNKYYLDKMQDIAGKFTVEYPEQQIQIAEAYRNMPILLYDDQTGQELCTSCFQCQRVCPPQVIHMTQARHPDTGKPVPAVTEFIIEYDACMSCGFCAEVCPFDSIKMDHKFDFATAHHESLMMRKTDLMRPVSYYQSIAPNLWEQAKENAYKKLENSKKRRVGLIGIAPQMADQVAAQQAAAAAAAPPAPAAPAAAPDKPLSKEEKLAAIRAKKRAESGASGDAPPAPVPDKPMTKEERLAAIRAKKRAESGAPSDAPPPTPPPASDSSSAMSDEKKARLEAIRAKKRAESGAPSDPPPPTASPPGDSSSAMSDEKKARLEAIRAKKRAEQQSSESES